MTIETEATRRTPSHDDLESLFVNNESLDRIESYLNRFNPIRVMKMERMEIRHSAILAWLLDPRETHGLADNFLKAFICEAFRGQSDLGKPTALDIAQSDLRDTEIRREWQNIDIFALSTRNNLALIIENKLDSQQHSGQLKRYMQKVEELHQAQGLTLKIRGVFLTLYDEEPDDKRYAVINYESVCEILARFIEGDVSLFDSNVRTFLKHYLETLRDAAGMSTDLTKMEELARQLYRDHRRVLDFVMEHGASSDFANAANALFGKNIDGDNTEELDQVEIENRFYRYGHVGDDQVSFIPEEWYDALGEDQIDFPGCDGWWSGYPVITWIQLIGGTEGSKGRLRLYGEVGPISNHEFRSRLIESIREAAKEDRSRRIVFQKGAAEEGRKYSKFFKDNTVEVTDIQDADEMAEAIRKLLKRFRSEFETVAKALPLSLEYAEESE